MNTAGRVLRLGDDVQFHDVDYRVSGLDGDVALLVVGGEPPVAIQVGSLFADESFSIVGTKPLRRRITGPSLLFESLPTGVQHRATWLEGHLVEVLDGIPANAAPETAPKRIYDVTRNSMRQRETAKHAELVASGETMSFSTFQRLRHAYEKQGVLGLVDQRLIRPDPTAGQTDQRVVDAILSVLEQNVQQSSGTMDRLTRQVRTQLASEHGAGVVPFPSRATFHRLVARLAQGRLRPGLLAPVAP